MSFCRRVSRPNCLPVSEVCLRCVDFELAEAVKYLLPLSLLLFAEGELRFKLNSLFLRHARQGYFLTLQHHAHEVVELVI